MSQCTHHWGWVPCDKNGYTIEDTVDGLCRKDDLGPLNYLLCLSCGEKKEADK